MQHTHTNTHTLAAHTRQHTQSSTSTPPPCLCDRSSVSALLSSRQSCRKGLQLRSRWAGWVAQHTRQSVLQDSTAYGEQRPMLCRGSSVLPSVQGSAQGLPVFLFYPSWIHLCFFIQHLPCTMHSSRIHLCSSSRIYLFIMHSSRIHLCFFIQHLLVYHSFIQVPPLFYHPGSTCMPCSHPGSTCVYHPASTCIPSRTKTALAAHLGVASSMPCRGACCVPQKAAEPSKKQQQLQQPWRLIWTCRGTAAGPAEAQLDHLGQLRQQLWRLTWTFLNSARPRSYSSICCSSCP